MATEPSARPKRAPSANWSPDLSRRGGPRYQAIVEALMEDIGSNRLSPGARLPTHRALATALGVNLGTVTRAYAEARRLGLLVGAVGSGTYVHARNAAPRPAEDDGATGPIDLAFNQPALNYDSRALQAALAQIAERRSLARVFDYQVAPGPHAHRAAGAAWIARAGLEVAPDQVILSNGAQQGLLAAVLHFSRSGDALATEWLNYTGILRLSKLTDRRLIPLACDGAGIVPDAFAAACRHKPPAALICTPTIHNPTASLMPPERRREIVRIANRHGVAVIEDDIYGQLTAGAPAPLSSLGLDRWCYVGGTSKSLVPGLRVGFVAAPREACASLAEIVRTVSWTTASLLAEVFALLIAEGAADEMIAWHRRETSARQAAAQRVLGGLAYMRHPCSYHIWMPLPEAWQADAFAIELARAGVLVTPSRTFAVDAAPPVQAIRISLGGPRNLSLLERGLSMIAAAAATTPSAPKAVV